MKMPTLLRSAGCPHIPTRTEIEPIAPEKDVLTFATLQRVACYLPIECLEDGCLYLIHARNSHIGQWRAAEKGFVLLRDKSGQRFLSMEFHWDASASGTAKPFFKISDPISHEALRGCLETKLAELTYEAFAERTKLFLLLQ